jgi:vacuolar protein sorting-associated protein 13A/C
MKNEDGLELKVALARCMRQDSTIRLSIAAYYVVINQTGMTLQLISDTHYKDKKAMGQVFTVPPAEDGKPFSMFSHPNTKSVKNRVRIRAADSNWSEPISFDAVGAEIELHCKSMLTARWYNIGGYVGLGQGKVGGDRAVLLMLLVCVHKDGLSVSSILCS